MNKKDTKTAIVAAEIDKNSNLIGQIECVDIKDGNARTISLNTNIVKNGYNVAITSAPTLNELVEHPETLEIMSEGNQ